MFPDRAEVSDRSTSRSRRLNLACLAIFAGFFAMVVRSDGTLAAFPNVATIALAQSAPEPANPQESPSTNRPAVASQLQAKPLTLAQLKAAALAPLESIESISGEFKLSFTPPKDLKVNRPDGSYGGKAWGPEFWKWTDHGSRRLMVRQLDPTSQPMGGRNWYSLTDRYEFSGSVPQDPSQPYRLLRRQLMNRNASRIESYTTPSQFMGLRLYYTVETVAGLLRSRGVLATPLTIDGVECPGIDFGRVVGVNSSSKLVSVWFDPRYQYRVRRIAYSIDPTRPNRANLEALNWHEVFEVERYIEIEDLAGGQKIPFPGICHRHNQAGSWRVELVEARANLPLTVADFTPPMPVGTTVNLTDTPTDQPAQSYVVGGKQQLDHLVQDRIRESRQLKHPLEHGQETTDARVDKGWPAGALLIFLAATLALLMLGIWWRFA